MNMLRYTHLAYMVFTYIFAFILLKPKRIKELLPVTVISIVVLATSDIFITSLKLYQYNKPLVNVLGAPLFHLLWAAGAGIVFIHFIKPGFARKFATIIIFTLITLALEFIAEKAGVASRLGNFTVFHSAILDFSSLVVLLWISEGLYGDRIYGAHRRF